MRIRSSIDGNPIYEMEKSDLPRIVQAYGSYSEYLRIITREANDIHGMLENYGAIVFYNFEKLSFDQYKIRAITFQILERFGVSRNQRGCNEYVIDKIRSDDFSDGDFPKSLSLLSALSDTPQYELKWKEMFNDCLPSGGWSDTIQLKQGAAILHGIAGNSGLVNAIVLKHMKSLIKPLSDADIRSNGIESSDADPVYSKEILFVPIPDVPLDSVYSMDDGRLDIAPEFKEYFGNRNFTFFSGGVKVDINRRLLLSSYPFNRIDSALHVESTRKLIRKDDGIGDYVRYVDEIKFNDGGVGARVLLRTLDDLLTSFWLTAPNIQTAILFEYIKRVIGDEE